MPDKELKQLLGDPESRRQLDRSEVIRSYIDALPKTLTDTPLYFNTYAQMFMRYSLKVNTTPWQQIANHENVVANGIYLASGAVFALILGFITQQSFARMIREKMNGLIEKNDSPMHKFLNGAAAFFKGVVKDQAIGLWLFLLLCKSHHVNNNPPSEYFINSQLFSGIFFVGIFFAEFSIFSKAPSDNDLLDSIGLPKQAFLFYVSLSSSLGTAWTYFTSVDGYLKHIGLAANNMSSYAADENPAIALASVAFLAVAGIMSLLLFSSTMRKVHYSVGVNTLKSRKISQWRSQHPSLVAHEIKLSGLWKSFVSSTSAAALIYTLAHALVQACGGTTSAGHSVGLSANIFAVMALTVLSKKAQTAGLMLPYVKKQPESSTGNRCCV